MELYTRALELNPREPRLYLGRGKSYLELDEFEKAKSDFEKASAVSSKLHLKKQAEELQKRLPVFDYQTNQLSN